MCVVAHIVSRVSPSKNEYISPEESGKLSTSIVNSDLLSQPRGSDPLKLTKTTFRVSYLIVVVIS
jgi:hypothetical protein